MADYKMVTEWGPNYKNILVGKLTEGKGFANKLKNLIQNPVQDDNLSVTDSAHQLVINMLASFSDAISVLTSCDDDSDGFSDQIPAVGSTCSGDRMSECSGQSRKRPDRRGCYKRRKTSDSTRIIVAPTSEDEYAWRKYGQKEILNAKQPRFGFSPSTCCIKHLCVSITPFGNPVVPDEYGKVRASFGSIEISGKSVWLDSERVEKCKQLCGGSST